MNKQIGITLISLTITIVVLIIIASITVYVGKDLINEANLQDLRTNMLLIQAEAKKGLEEASFQNCTDLSKAEEKDLIIGTREMSPEIQQKIPTEYAEKVLYYISEEDLEKMGLKDIKQDDKEGYYFVEYNLQEISVEVINSVGYQGKYTLTDLNKLVDESDDI